MIETVRKLIEMMNGAQFTQILEGSTLAAYGVGLTTGGADMKLTTHLEPDMDSIASIGLRTHALSESTMAQAKGSLAHEANKLYDEMNAAVKAGMSEREALGGIEGRLRKLFDESFEEWKLERLVRDQVAVATKEGRRDGWQAGGAKWRQWKMHSDKKTAGDSKRMNGQIAAIDEPYVDPLTKDKYMIPHIRPNDRCYEIPLFDMPEHTIKNGLKYAKGVEMEFAKAWTKEARLKALEARRRKLKSKEVLEFKKTLIDVPTDKLRDKFKEVEDYHLGLWYEPQEFAGMEDFENIVTDTLHLEHDNQRGPIWKKQSSTKVLQMYLVTQEYLKRINPSGTVELYRGVGERTYDKLQENKVGETIATENYNVSSWTTDRKVATDFAEGILRSEIKTVERGVVFKANFDNKNILVHPDLTSFEPASSYAYNGISEVTVISKNKNVEIVSKHSQEFNKKAFGQIKRIHIGEDVEDDKWLHFMRNKSFSKAWTDAARKAAAEARKRKGNTTDLTDIVKTKKEIEEVLKKGGWDITKAEIFGKGSGFGDTIHIHNDKIYAMSDISVNAGRTQIDHLEVNPEMRRKGFGIVAMADIVKNSISEKRSGIILTSADENSDKFYTAIGMSTMDSPDSPEHLKSHTFRGDETWMKKFLKSISKKQ